jgi:hypothetical protein
MLGKTENELIDFVKELPGNFKLIEHDGYGEKDTQIHFFTEYHITDDITLKLCVIFLDYTSTLRKPYCIETKIFYPDCPLGKMVHDADWRAELSIQDISDLWEDLMNFYKKNYLQDK